MRGFSTLLFSNAGAQLINLLAIPILTRIYAPELWGYHGVYLAVINIGYLLFTFNFHTANGLHCSASEKKIITYSIETISNYILKLALLILCIYNIVSFDPFKFFMGVLLILGSYCVALCHVYEQRIYSSQLFKVYGLICIVSVIISQTLKIIFGIKFGNVWLLLFPLTFLYITRVYLYKKMFKEKLLIYISFSKLKKSLLKYDYLLKYRFLQTLMSASSFYLPIFFISYYYTMNDVGMYSLAYSSVGAILLVLSNSINNYIFPIISRKYNENLESARNYVKNLVYILIGFSLATYFISVYSLEFAFTVVFGQEWSTAGTLAKYLILQFLSVIITRPVISWITVNKDNRSYLVYELFTWILKVSTSLFFILYYDVSVINYVFYYSLLVMATYLFSITYILRRDKK